MIGRTSLARAGPSGGRPRTTDNDQRRPPTTAQPQVSWGVRLSDQGRITGGSDPGQEVTPHTQACTRRAPSCLDGAPRIRTRSRAIRSSRRTGTARPTGSRSRSPSRSRRRRGRAGTPLQQGFPAEGQWSGIRPWVPPHGRTRCRLCPLHAHRGRRINSAQGHGPPAGAGRDPGRGRPRPGSCCAPWATYAPSTCVGGWISSACSPVTRYTTRLATDTAWSAKRS